MSPDLLFSLSNMLALLGWLMLALLPRKLSVFPIPTRFVIPAILAIAYAIAIIPGLAGAEGGFTTLDDLKRLYETSTDPLVVAGWQHYLAFDLFVGTWIAERMDGLRVHRLAQIPVLAATFMLGPIGLLLAFAVEVGLRLYRSRAGAN